MNIRFIIILELANLIHTHLEANDICIRHEQKCKPYLDFKIICEKMNCEQHQEYNYSCGLNYCSTSKHKCDEMNLHRELLKIQHKKIKPFLKLLKSIRKCPILVDLFKVSDICMKNNKCFVLHKMIFATFEIKHLSKTDCKCNDEKHSFECGQKYCSTNQNKCNQFESIKNNTNFEKIKYCSDQINVVEKKIIF